MSELLRLVLLIALAGAALTFLAALAAWSMAEERRLARAFRRVLGQPPDAFLVAYGYGKGAAISLAGGRMAVAWSAGGWCLLYGLGELLGAELTLDGQVVARVRRGATRKALDRAARPDAEVRLRLLFDDPLHPDFELELWPPGRPSRAAPPQASAALAEGNRWLGRIEAVLRRTGLGVRRPEPAPSPAAEEAEPETEDLFEYDEEEPPF
ncbi:MAG: hypothetical protein JO127_08815 [Caulobacteraceae bacterium]|nr:hypothetical protein [Caulobacteraceae bacterium]